MSEKQITPVEALTIISDTMKNISIDATLHVNHYVLEALSKINETAKAGLQAASQPPEITLEEVRPLLKQAFELTDGHEERAEKSWADIQKRLVEPSAVNGAVWVKAYLNAFQNYLIQFADKTENEHHRNIYNTHVGDIHTALSVLERYPGFVFEDDVYLDESPTAAGDGKEAILEVLDAVGLYGLQRDNNGHWHRPGYPVDLPKDCTTAQLYNILTDKNK